MLKSFKSLLETIHDLRSHKEIGKTDNLHKLLSKHYHFDAKIKNHVDRYAYSPSEDKNVKELHKYTQGDTRNDYLWEKSKNNSFKFNKFKKSYEDAVENTNNALHYHKTPFSFHVYSNTRMDPTQHKDENDVVHHPAFMSTTISKDYPKKWHNIGYNEKGNVVRHILKIKIPKGSPGAYVEHFSAVPGQHEFILPHGHNLKYHKSEEYKDKNHIINIYHHMSLIPEENK